MKKQTKVLAAATLFTLGASFSAFAALKNGTWVNSEDGWQYFDKEGEVVEEEWCYDGTTEYWVNEEGFLGADEWVSDEEYSYYVKADGSKAKGEWQFVYGEDDEDADEESWFYFDAKGRMAEKEKRTVNGKTYYFDEEGKMLTGWVEYTEDADGNVVTCEPADENTGVGSVVYCDENGALVKSAWLHQFPWTEDADDMYEGEDEQWYYAKSNGKLATGKQASIDGYTYFFNNNTGVMLEGWVVGHENEDGDLVYTSSNGTKFTAEGADVAYFCTEDGAGYAKKNGWRELEDTTEDDDFWFHFDKLGRVFWAAADAQEYVQTVDFVDGEDKDGNIVINETRTTVESKKIDGVKYYFNQNGEMIDGFVAINGNLMYLDGGAAQTGKVELTDENENDYTFYFAEKTVDDDNYEKYVAINGNKDGYCYKNGQLMKSEESGVYELVTVAEGVQFIVDYRGKIQHKEGKEYDGVDGTYTFAEDNDGLYEDMIAGEYTAQ